jgi:hypothetical protein
MKSDFEEMAGTEGAADAAPIVPARRPVVTLDVALYESYLADSGMTEDQKREFLELLWSIIVGFVDLGFAIDPVQQAVGADCGGQNSETSGSGDADLLLSDDQSKPKNETPNLRAEIASAVRKGRSQ